MEIFGAKNMTSPRLICLTSLCIVTAGCTSLGGNVKGNFVCEAPGGICSPTSAIDDQAISSMTAETGGVQSKSDGSQFHSPNALKIVLPARQDRFGRWRDQAVVYAEPEVVPSTGVSSEQPKGTFSQRLSLAELAAGAPPTGVVSSRKNLSPGSGNFESPIDRIKAEVRSVVSPANNPNTPPQLTVEPLPPMDNVSSGPQVGLNEVVVAPVFVPGTGKDD